MHCKCKLFISFSKVTSRSAIFDILMRPIRKDQIMPTETRAMRLAINFDLNASDPPESLKSVSEK